MLLQSLQKALYIYLNKPALALGMPVYTSIPSVMNYPYGRFTLTPELVEVHRTTLLMAKCTIDLFVKTNNNAIIHDTIHKLRTALDYEYIRNNIAPEELIQAYTFTITDLGAIPDIEHGVQHIYMNTNCYLN